MMGEKEKASSLHHRLRSMFDGSAVPLRLRVSIQWRHRKDKQNSLWDFECCDRRFSLQATDVHLLPESR